MHRCYIYQFPAYFTLTQVFKFLFVSIVLLILYARIFGQIRKQLWQIHAQPLSSLGRIRFELKATMTSFLTVGCFTLCWLPIVLIIIIGLYYTQNNIAPKVLKNYVRIVELLLIANSGMNPVIYIIRIRLFRKAYVRLFHCKK